MFPKITLIAATAGAAMAFAAPAFGDSWYLDEQQPTVRVSPDTADYAEAARAKRLAAMLDAKERALITRPQSRSDVPTRLEPPAVTTSRGEIEWPQLALGFGLGLLSAFGLAVGLRLRQVRAPAH